MFEKKNIGLTAGLVWHKLNETGDIIIPRLARELKLGAEETALAIGWLMRENKVHIERKDGLLYVRNE